MRRPPRSTLSSSSAASDVYKRQVLSLTACGSGSNSFTWFVDSIPANLDPQVASSAADVIACENLYSGLVRRTPDGQLLSLIHI